MKKYKYLQVEHKELTLLKRLLGSGQVRHDSVYAASVAKLCDELRSAVIHDNTEMPVDVVRINSLVTIRMPDKKEKSIQLVLPDKSNILQSRISLLAPMGLALYGYAQGDDVLWEFPSGTNKIKIIKVTQVLPELTESVPC